MNLFQNAPQVQFNTGRVLNTQTGKWTKPKAVANPFAPGWVPLPAGAPLNPPANNFPQPIANNNNNNMATIPPPPPNPVQPKTFIAKKPITSTGLVSKAINALTGKGDPTPAAAPAPAAVVTASNVPPAPPVPHWVGSASKGHWRGPQIKGYRWSKKLQRYVKSRRRTRRSRSRVRVVYRYRTRRSRRSRSRRSRRSRSRRSRRSRSRRSRSRRYRRRSRR